MDEPKLVIGIDLASGPDTTENIDRYHGMIDTLRADLNCVLGVPDFMVKHRNRPTNHHPTSPRKVR